MTRKSFWDDDAVILDPDREQRQREAGLTQKQIDNLKFIADTDPQQAFMLADILGSQEEYPLTLKDFEPLEFEEEFAYEDDDSYEDYSEDDYSEDY